MNASKTRFAAKDLSRLFQGASRIVVAKGRKVVDFDMKNDPPPAAELQKVVLGPTGNLRAPAIRAGKTWLIGFHEEVYGERFA